MVYAVLVLEILLLAASIGSWVRDRQALRRFVNAAPSPDHFKEVAMRLPFAYRAPATQFAGELARKASLDDIIVQAIIQAANAVYGLPLLAWLAASALTAIALLAPFGSALFRTARQIQDSAGRVAELAGAPAFLAMKSQLDPAFEGLHETARWTALLIALMVIVVSVHWLLNRSEAREARFIQALLQAAIAAKPGSGAPVASRLSELLAPPRGLTGPVTAFAIFMATTGAGWMLLTVTADVKKANALEVYDVWPSDSRPEITVPPGMLPQIGRFGGGSPMKNGTVGILSIGPRALEIASESIVFLSEDQRLPPDWRKKEGGEKLQRVLNTLEATKTSVAIIADQRLHLSQLLDVVTALREHNVSHVHLVVARTIMSPGVQGGDRIYAGLRFKLSPPDGEAPLVRFVINPSNVVIDPGTNQNATIDLRREDSWRKELNRATQTRIKQAGVRSAINVAVKIESTDSTYGRFIEILSAADATCEGETDCGVPGMGLNFYWER